MANIRITFIYSSLTICTSSGTSISSLDMLHLFFFSYLLFPFLVFSTATKYFPSLFFLCFSFLELPSSLRASNFHWNVWLNLKVSRLVSAEELLVLLHSNTAKIFIATILLKLLFSYLLCLLLKLKATRMVAFNHQCFHVYFDVHVFYS